MATGQRLRGLVGQGMDGRREQQRPRIYRITDLTSASSGSIAADQGGYIELLAWGGGGSGSSSTGGGRVGGGGAAGIYLRLRVSKGQVVRYAIGAGGPAAANSNGNNGGDTTILDARGLVHVAGGGRGGGTLLGATGGLARPNGGALGSNGGGTSGNNGVAGDDGGGSGGLDSGTRGGGGGAAGFASLIAGLTYGAGGQGLSSPTPGGGGGAGNDSGSSQAGAAGRLLVYWYRLV